MLINKPFIYLENFPPNKQEIMCKSCYSCSVPWFFPLNYKTVTIIQRWGRMSKRETCSISMKLYWSKFFFYAKAITIDSVFAALER